MADSDYVQNALDLGDPGKDARLGGVVLIIGTILGLITIGLEFNVGWLTRSTETSPEEMIAVFLELWDSLRWIWRLQMIAAFLSALGAFMLVGAPQRRGQLLPAKLIWYAIAIGYVLSTASYGLTLGGYPPALAVAEQQPELFSATRGGIRSLYEVGGYAQIGLFIIFFWEGILKEGIVPRSWVLGATGVFVTAIALVIAGAIHPRVAGPVGLIVPVLLGLAYWRVGRQLAS